MYKGDAEEKDSRAFSSWKEGGMKCPGFVCVSTKPLSTALRCLLCFVGLSIYMHFVFSIALCMLSASDPSPIWSLLKISGEKGSQGCLIYLHVYFLTYGERNEGGKEGGIRPV
jgi:hypothetical protein